MACYSVTLTCFSKTASLVNSFTPSFIDCFCSLPFTLYSFFFSIKFCIYFEFLWCLFLGSGFSDLMFPSLLIRYGIPFKTQLVLSVNFVELISLCRRYVLIMNPAMGICERLLNRLALEER